MAESPTARDPGTRIDPVAADAGPSEVPHSDLPIALEHLLARTHGLSGKLVTLVVAYTVLAGILAFAILVPQSPLGQMIEGLGMSGAVQRAMLLAVVLVPPAVGLAVILYLMMGGPLKGIAEAMPPHDWQPVQPRMLSDYSNLRWQMRSLNNELKSLRSEKQKLVGELDALAEQQKSAMATLAGAVALTRDSLILTDIDGKVRDLSPTALELLKVNRADALGKPFTDVVRLFDPNENPSTDHPLPDLARKTVERRTSIPQLQQAVMLNGENQQMSMLVGATAILDHRSNVAGALVRIELYGGMGEEKEARETSRAVATGEDPMTGLLTGKSLDKRMEMLINVARSQNAHHCILFIALDNFEEVCSTFTHWAGEELLWQLGQLLRGSVPEGGECFRVSSLHFAVLLPFTASESALATAERLRVLVEGREFKWGEMKFESTISVGVVGVEAASEGPKVLLGYANKALAAARAKGGNCVYEFPPDKKVETQRKDDRQWVTWLNRSLRQGRAHIISQLIEPLARDLAPQPMMEVLMRIEDEDGVWITPAAFLPSIVRHNLTSQLDLWMLRRVLQVLSGNAKLLADHSMISINLARPSITEPEFAERVTEVLADTRIPAERICFEVEAMVSISHPSEFARFVNTVRPTGARFALDKCKAALGLNALVNLPVDYVKIHEALIKSAISNPLDQAYLEWINQATHKLHRRTIATGVENQEMMDLLRQVGVDYAQGVHINKLGPLMA